MNAHTFPVAAAPAHHLAEKAMLAGIRISIWEARTIDRRVTDETNAAHNADADAGRYNKTLLPKHALAAIREIAGKARRVLYARTLPWSDNGNRILSAAGYDDFAKAMRDVESEFNAAVAEFVGKYPAFLAAEPARLNGMFDAGDYPAPEEIAARFSFKRRIWPMPDAADFRVDMTAGERERIKSEIAAELSDTLHDAMRDVFGRIAETVGAMATKLALFKPAEGKSKAEGIFRDSLVSNVGELVALLPSLNITGDSRIAALTERMRALASHKPDDLRDDAHLRSQVATEAAAIKSTVDDYLA